MAEETNSNESQTLLIDADDTLWENNIYFERAIANFISFLNHHEIFSSAGTRGAKPGGTGIIINARLRLHSFAPSLVEPSSGGRSETDHAGRSIRHQRIPVPPGLAPRVPAEENIRGDSGKK